MDEYEQPTNPPRPPAGDVPDPEISGMHPEQAAAVRQVRRTLRLTDRWTALDPHPQQALFCYHPSRFKINPSGRRSGKTELAKRKKVLRLIRRQKWPVKEFAAAPSFGQARDIFWQDFRDLIPRAWVAATSETRLEIVTRWGAMIRVFGFDRPRRIEGVPWDDGLVDEIADCPKDCFSRSVRPALATLGRNGTCDLIGVPKEVGRNQIEYEKLWDLGLQWPQDPDICSFHWPSSDIIPAEAASYARQVDSLTYAEQMGGKFVTSGGKAIPDFDTKYHVKDEFAAYDPRLPLDWTLDFGRTPAASLLCQEYGGFIWVIDQIVIPNDASTLGQLAVFRQKLAEHRWNPRRIRIFGDASGRHPGTARGESDYQMLEEYGADLPFEWRQLRVNPPIPDTINAVRCRAKSSVGLVRMHIHSRCEMLIEDLKTAPWPDPDDLHHYHALAALRYYCYGLFGGTPTIMGTTPLALPKLAGMSRRR